MIDVIALSVRAKPYADRKPSGRPIMTFEEAMKGLPSKSEFWDKAGEMAKEAAAKVTAKEQG